LLFKNAKNFTELHFFRSFEFPRVHSPLLAAGLASKKKIQLGIEDSSQLAARSFNFIRQNYQMVNPL